MAETKTSTNVIAPSTIAAHVFRNNPWSGWTSRRFEKEPSSAVHLYIHTLQVVQRMCPLGNNNATCTVQYKHRGRSTYRLPGDFARDMRYQVPCKDYPNVLVDSCGPPTPRPPEPLTSSLASVAGALTSNRSVEVCIFSLLFGHCACLYSNSNIISCLCFIYLALLGFLALMSGADRKSESRVRHSSRHQCRAESDSQEIPIPT